MFIGKTQSLDINLMNVYNNYGSYSENISLWKNLSIRIWNAIKFIFDQSDWQITSKQLAAIIQKEGDKNSGNYYLVSFPGLREDMFTLSEAREIGDHLLTKLVEKKNKKNFSDAILSTRKRLEQCIGEVLFKKADRYPNMFPELDCSKGSDFKTAPRKKQLELLCDAAGCRPSVLIPMLYDIANGKYDEDNPNFFD